MNIPEKAFKAGWLASQSGHIGSREVRRILGAAAPFIAAQALRDKSRDMLDPRDTDELLESADEMEGE